MKSKSMMWKTTLREIRQSLGRYLAILAIVALGVGFFAGLKASKPAMVETGDQYFKENALYDFRLICTLGFDDKIVQEINKRQDVRVAQGAYSYDILCSSSSDGNVNVIKAHSITEGVNEPRVLAGRLPLKANECVVDSGMYSKKYIGKKIKLSDTNEEADLEHFAYEEYRIVGVVESPMYIHFERGSSSLGNGKVSGFMYLKPEGFVSEAYTEVYVKLTEDFDLYDERYDEYMDEKEPEWEAFLEVLGEMRYDNVLVEGNSKLADAKQELDDAKKEADVELADAKQELDDAAAEIEDGKTQIADARKEIEDGWAEIASEEKKLEDAIVTIAKNEKLLLDKESELEEGIEQWKDGKAILQTSKDQLDEGAKVIGVQESQLVTGEQQLAEKEAELIVGEEQFASGEKLIQSSLKAVEEQETQLNEQEQEWIASVGVVPDYILDVINSQREGLSATKDILLASLDEMEKQKPQLVEGRKQLEAAKAQLQDGRQQLGSAKEQIEDGKKQLEEGKKELDASWENIKDGRKQINEGRLELLAARKDVEDGTWQIEDAKKELEEGQKELDEKEQELLDGEQEYLDGLAEYEEALAEYEQEIADAEIKIADARKDLQEIEKPDNYLLGRDTNLGYVMFQNDTDIVENISTVFPIFFFLVAALVCMTTMTRMIEEQRTQIGTLKALGYSKKTIMGKYMFYSGSAAVLGCLGGFLAGIFLFPYVIWICYGLMYDMGNMHFVFDWKLASIALLVSLLCSVGTTWYSCHKELNEVAAQLMRPKTPQAGKRIWLERISFIWKRLKFLQKVSIRNVFRYKKRFFMMVLGISGCGALILAAFGLKDSISDVMGMQYDNIQTYDMGVSVKDNIDDDVIEELASCFNENVTEYSILSESTVELKTTSGNKSINLVVAKEPDQLPRFIDMHTVDGKPINVPQSGECVITHKVAQDYDIQVGDTIEFFDGDYHTISVTVNGIMQNFIYNYMYIHPDTYKEHPGQMPEYKSIYMNVSDETDKNLLSASLMKLDSVTAVSINEDVRERFEALMANLDYVVLLVLVCAASLAFIVIYNLTNINITERIREIATIKVLGFYRKETSTYVFRENLLLTLVGAVVGLALGKVLHQFIMDCVKIDMIAFDVRINPVSYVYSVCLTLLFAICVNKLMTGKLDKISMTESLKSVD